MGNEEVFTLEIVGRFEEENISTLEEGDFIFLVMFLFVVIECWRCFFFFFNGVPHQTKY